MVLGLYLWEHPHGWRLALQRMGSSLIFLSAMLLLIAFLGEPNLGLAGRSLRSYIGLISLFAGVMTHLAASIGSKPN